MPLRHLQKFVAEGDVTGLMLASIRLWMETYHPEVRYSVLVGEIGNGAPSLKVPVINPAPASEPCVVTGG